MSLANLITFVAGANIDPSTTPDMVEEETTKTVVSRQAVSTPIHETKKDESMKRDPLPAAGTLDAKGFILAVRKAKSRDESIAAIAAYCGYDNRRNFGTQDQEARAKAMREIRGFQATGPTREEKRAAERSVAGYVKGMPAPSQRILLNLQARERAAVDAMLAAKKAGNPVEENEHRKMLDTIRKAIDELVG